MKDCCDKCCDEYREVGMSSGMGSSFCRNKGCECHQPKERIACRKCGDDVEVPKGRQVCFQCRPEKEKGCENCLKQNREICRKKTGYCADDHKCIICNCPCHLNKPEAKCAGCKDCLDSDATTGEQCVKMRDCDCHKYPNQVCDICQKVPPSEKKAATDSELVTIVSDFRNTMMDTLLKEIREVRRIPNYQEGGDYHVDEGFNAGIETALKIISLKKHKKI